MRISDKPVSSSLYDAEYYKSANHGYSEFLENKGLPQEIMKKVTKIDVQGKTVLDLGCGRGEFVRYCTTKGAEVYGIDYSDASVNISKKTLADLSENIRSHAHIKKMDVKKLKFEDNTFDLITGFDIIEHLHDWELKEAISEIKRVIKPQGQLLLHTSPNKLMMETVRKVVRLFGVSLRSDKFHVNEISYFSARRYFEDFEPNITLEKEKNYWSNQMDFRGKALKSIAKILDTLLDCKPIHSILSLFPLSILTCTDIWISGTKK